MPQESKRSVGFRPFITCDDPRGVVECNTITKPKTNPIQKGEHDQRSESHRRKHRDLNQHYVMTKLSRLQESSNRMTEKGVLDKELARDSVEDSKGVTSTSSGQSSIVFSGTFVSPESFLPSKSSQKKNKKERKLKLIAKLMGVEDVFLRSFPYSSWKNSGEGERIASQNKPAFDDHSPITRKHENETQRFKGLHKSNLLGGPNRNGRLSPIVIMKPVRFSCLNSDQPIIPKSRAKVDEEMLLNTRMRNYTSAKIDESEALQSRIKNPSRRKRRGDSIIMKIKQEVKDFKGDTSEMEITDYVNNDHSLQRETSLLTSVRKNESQASTAKKSLKALLRNSPTFINRVKEIFKLKVNSKIHNEDVKSDLSARVLIDCANELIESSHKTHKTSSITCSNTSLERLLGEVCDGIEALSGYREAHSENHSADISLLLVEGDLRRGMLGGVWDSGWECLGFADEVEEITRRVDEMVFGGLVKEILIDLNL